MKRMEDAMSRRENRPAAPVEKSCSVLSPEAWDRREHDPTEEAALDLLEHAARHLIFDQMQRHRLYDPGATDAVELLWAMMRSIREGRVARERVDRLSSVWLPQHVIARLKGGGPPSH